MYSKFSSWSNLVCTTSTTMIIALMVVRMPKLLYKVLSVCDLSKEVKIYKGLGRIPWPQLLILWHHKNPKPLQTQNQLLPHNMLLNA